MHKTVVIGSVIIDVYRLVDKMKNEKKRLIIQATSSEYRYITQTKVTIAVIINEP